MWPARRLRGAAALALALSYASANLGADESAPVQKPEVRVGEWWTYRYTEYPTNVPRLSNYHERVSFVGPNEILTVSGDRKSVV